MYNARQLLGFMYAFLWDAKLAEIDSHIGKLFCKENKYKKIFKKKSTCLKRVTNIIIII